MRSFARERCEHAGQGSHPFSAPSETREGKRDTCSCRPFWASLLTLVIALALVLLAGALAGCVQPAGEVFPPLADAKVWPPPPAPARVKYVGSISSAADLKPGRSWWDRITGEDPPQKLIAPMDVAVNADGRVFVADRDRQAVHSFDLSARRHELIGSGVLQLPAAVAWGGGRLFVADAKLGHVFVWSPARQQLARFDHTDLSRPAGLAYDEQRGRLYVADPPSGKVLVLNDAGELMTSLPAENGAVTLGSPTHVVYRPALGLLVTDAVNSRVVRFDPDGAFAGTIGSLGDGAGNLALPKGVAVDSEGHIYVVDARFENVQLFDRAGRVLMAFGEEGTRTGQFNLPSGLCIDDTNRIWVADTYNCRVQVFEFLGSAGQTELAQTLPPPSAGGVSNE